MYITLIWLPVRRVWTTLSYTGISWQPDRYLSSLIYLPGSQFRLLENRNDHSTYIEKLLCASKQVNTQKAFSRVPGIYQLWWLISCGCGRGRDESTAVRTAKDAEGPCQHCCRPCWPTPTHSGYRYDADYTVSHTQHTHTPSGPTQPLVSTSSQACLPLHSLEESEHVTEQDIWGLICKMARRRRGPRLGGQLY